MRLVMGLVIRLMVRLVMWLILLYSSLHFKRAACTDCIKVIFRKI